MVALRHAVRPPGRIAGGRTLRARGIGEVINWRELFALLTALVALATFVWWVTRPPGPVAMPLPAHAHTLNKPLDVFLAVDSSGSMIGPIGNDPNNTRLGDATVLLRWMRHNVARRGDGLHVAEFAQTLVPRVDRPLGAPGTTGLLGTAPDGPDTYFGPVADWVAGRVAPGRASVVVIVTDAAVPDGDAVLRRLRAVARRVVVIQIAHGKGGTVNTPGVQVINATTDRPQAVAAAAARVLLRTTGQGVE